MLGNFHVRTDLALEARESFEEDDVKIRGVRVETREDEEKEIRKTGPGPWESPWAPISRWRPRICPVRMRIITGRFRRSWRII